MYLKQSTSRVISFGPFLGSTGLVAVTSLVSAIDHATTGIMLSKQGGALAIRSQSVTASTYDAYGNYLVTLSVTDTNTIGDLRVQFYDGTNTPVWKDFKVLPASQYDAKFVANADGVVSVGTLAAGGNASTKTFTIPAAEYTNVKVGDWLNPISKLCARRIDAYDNATGVGTVDTVWPVNIGAVAYQVTLNYPGIPFVAADFTDGLFDTVKFSSGFLARLLASASVSRIDALEGTGLTITIGAGAHTTSACLASDASSGVRVKGRAGIVTSGGIIRRGVRFTGDIGASGAFGYTDLYGNAVPVALVQNDVIVVI